MKRFWGYLFGIITVAGFAIGIIGFILLISSIKISEISYNIQTPSYKIYDNELISQTSTLNFILKDSIDVDQNIFLATFSIWNSGDLPIKKEDLREKIEIKFSGVDKLLDLKVIKEVEEGISEFVLKQVNDSVFLLDWDFFDPAYGLKIQFIYFGKENIACEIGGNYYGTIFKEFLVEPKKRYISLTESVAKNPKLYFLFGLFLIFYYPAITYQDRRTLKIKESRVKIYYIGYILFMIFGALFIGYLIYTGFSGNTTLPF